MAAVERDFGEAKNCEKRNVAEHFEGAEWVVGAQKRKSSHALVVDFGARNNLRRVQNWSSIVTPKRYFRGQRSVIFSERQ